MTLEINSTPSTSGYFTRKSRDVSWNIILESESSVPSEEDTESIYSVQGRETEYAKDTSDTSSDSEGSSYGGGVRMSLQYDVNSDCSSNGGHMFDMESSSGREDFVTAATFLAAAMCESDLGLWGDTEDSMSACSIDSELGRADYWKCIQCKNANNNPLFRYCERCYQARKNFFPPRPKARKRKEANLKSLVALGSAGQSSQSQSSDVTELAPLCVKQATKRKHSDSFSSTSDDSEQLAIPQLSQDSGFGPSQEIINTDYSKIVIPEKMLKTNGNVNTNATNTKITVANQQMRNDEPAVKKVCVDAVDSDKKVCVDAIDSDKKVCVDAVDSDNKVCVDSAHNSSSADSPMCITCLIRPRNGVFIHGGMGHLVCCYECAVKVFNSTKRCPICGRNIQNIIRVFAP